MPGTEARSWRFLITPKWLAWHLIMVVSVIGMLLLGRWQLERAVSGNALSVISFAELNRFCLRFPSRAERSRNHDRRGKREIVDRHRMLRRALMRLDDRERHRPGAELLQRLGRRDLFSEGDGPAGPDNQFNRQTTRLPAFHDPTPWQP